MLSKEISVDIGKMTEYGKEIGCKVKFKSSLDSHELTFEL